jgi:hypothetical protein
MKKLILSAGMLCLAMTFASAQGYTPTGVSDDFSTSGSYDGAYWFETTGETTLKIERNGTGYMDVVVDEAGACTNQTPNCYPVLGLEFGTQTIDLSGNANIVLDIENRVDEFVFVAVELEDINGVKAQIEPNVSDVLPGSTWEEPAQPRKALNGFTFVQDERKTLTIDLSSVPGAVGGLTRGTDDCGSGPYYCPNTSYEIDITKIKTILFVVNFGKSNIFISEADGDHRADTFIPGTDIFPYTGTLRFHDFKVGTPTPSTSVANTVIEKSLSVYPNPAQEMLNVEFETVNGADVTLTDLVGNAVYSTSAGAGSNALSVNTSAFPTGLYILNVATENGRVARKVNIQ